MKRVLEGEYLILSFGSHRDLRNIEGLPADLPKHYAIIATKRGSWLLTFTNETHCASYHFYLMLSSPFLSSSLNPGIIYCKITGSPTVGQLISEFRVRFFYLIIARLISFYSNESGRNLSFSNAVRGLFGADRWQLPLMSKLAVTKPIIIKGPVSRENPNRNFFEVCLCLHTYSDSYGP